MKKITFIFIFGLLSMLALNAQIPEKNVAQPLLKESKTIKQAFISIGPGFGTHQDQIYSLGVSSGIGGGFDLGFIRTEKNIFRTYLGANVNLAIQEFGISSIIAEGLLNFTWLKGLKQTNKNKFFVGGELEAGLLFRNTSGLGNNSLSFLFNNTLSGTARIERPLPNTRWTLGGELSLGLISWVRNSSGYAFSTPQAFLTNGEFNYDDDVIFKFYKYGKIEPIGKFHRMKTNISFIQNRERISWGGIYNWRMKAYDPYESGQIVQGTHLIKFYFGFNFGVRKNRMK